MDYQFAEQTLQEKFIAFPLNSNPLRSCGQITSTMLKQKLLKAPRTPKFRMKIPKFGDIYVTNCHRGAGVVGYYKRK